MIEIGAIFHLAPPADVLQRAALLPFTSDFNPLLKVYGIINP